MSSYMLNINYKKANLIQRAVLVISSYTFNINAFTIESNSCCLVVACVINFVRNVIIMLV